MSSFCICKSYSHFFSKNTCELDIVLSRTVNILTTNELIRLLCFRHLSESRFLLDALNRRSKFANFCHDLMQNHLSQLPMYKIFYSSHWFLKSQIFSLFPIVKMKPNHAEIYRVGNLEPNFQQVPLVQFF